MSNSFFIVLPSNTKSYEENKTNKFRVHLPRKLELEGNWVCGLHSIVYPNTWPAIGTTELQYIIVSTKSGTNIKFSIPKGSYLTPQELETTLYSGVIREVENLKKLISADNDVNRKRRRRDIKDKEEIIRDTVIETNTAVDDDENASASSVALRLERERAAVREELKAREEARKTVKPSVSEEIKLPVPSPSTVKETSTHIKTKAQIPSSEQRDPAPSSRAPTETSETRSSYSSNAIRATARENVRKTSDISRSRDLRHKFVETFVENIDENEERSEIIDKIDGLKTVDINKIKEGYESIRNSTFKIQKKTFGKGEIFNKHSDLREQWIKNPKKDWKSLEELLKILGQREPRIYPNREQSIRFHLEYRKKIIAELAEEGSEFRVELSNLVNDQDQFFTSLKNENFTRRPGRYLNLDNLNQYEYKASQMLELVSGVKFEYLEDIRRFSLKISDPDVSEIYLSDQICYVLGFDVGSPIKHGDIAKYACDLRGGVSHICVYANGVTDQMIVGDKLASLLQIVAVTGAPGDVIEKKYDAPLFNKVISKNIDEIEIEIRTLEGRLVPFDYGVVIITLIFKKLILF